MALHEFSVFWEPSIAGGLPFCWGDIHEAQQGLRLLF